VRRVKQQRTEPRFAAIDLTIAATMFGLLSSGGLPFSCNSFGNHPLEKSDDVRRALDKCWDIDTRLDLELAI
jgi:hypothetical protein